MGAHRIFKIETPFSADEIFDVGFEQSTDIIYLTHLAHDPQKLTRFGHTQWLIDDVAFATKTASPTNVTATKGGGTPSGYTPIDHTYTVTAVDEVTGEESLIGNSDTIANDLTLTDLFNTITWDAVAGADYYNVYKDVNGIWGYIGSAEVLTFRDQNIAPDLSDTPPSNRNPFSGDDDKPAAVTFYEQRAVYGRTGNRPSAIYGSQSAHFENMNVARPAKASDAYTFNLVGRQVNAIRHLVPMKSLIALCDTSIQALRGPDGIITPTEVDITPEGYRGTGRARPALIDDVTFYSTAKGNSIRTLGYSFEAEGWKGNDITVFAPHLFRGYTTVEMAWSEHPTSTLWVLRSDGKLCALTWLQEQEIWGWTLCETDGVVESICVVTENLEDILYAVIRRTIDGQELRYIERLTSPYLRQDGDNGDSVFEATYLDCHRTYTGEPVASIGGLGYLEGRTVTALVNGAVVKNLVVEDGVITLPGGAPTGEEMIATVGIPYESWVQTLSPVVTLNQVGSSKGLAVSLPDVMVDLIDTRGIELAAGKRIGARTTPSAANVAEGEFFEPNPRTDEPMGSPPYLMNGEVEVPLGAGNWKDGTVVIRQRNPLPMHVTGIFPRAEFGGR